MLRAWPRPLLKRAFAKIPESEFVILTPRETKLYRKRNRRAPRSERKNVIETETAWSQQQLLADQILQEPSTETALSNIEQSRPETRVMSPQGLDKIVSSLKKGYTKQQLFDYLSKNGVIMSKTANKAKILEKLVSQVWGLSSASSKSINNSQWQQFTIELSERRFMLMIMNNGFLLRKFAQSGARVWVRPEKRELVVHSSQKTFDWISTAIYSAEEHVTVTEIDLTEIQGLGGIDDAQLSLLQKTTDTYITRSESRPLLLLVNSLSANVLKPVRRLLSHLLPKSSNWARQRFLYDTQQENLSRCTFLPYEDPDTMEWLNRSSNWQRWEVPRVRGEQTALEPPQYKELAPPEFKQADMPSESEGLVDQIHEVFGQEKNITPTGDSMTFSATMGFIFHKSSGHLLPTAHQSRMFLSHVPFVSGFVSELSAYHEDVLQREPIETSDQTEVKPKQPEQEVKLEQTEQEVKFEQPEPKGKSDWKDLLKLDPVELSAGLDPSDPWAKLLASEARPVYTEKKDKQTVDVITLLRIVLTPSPFDNNQNESVIAKYPPIEVWCPITQSGLNFSDIEDTRVVAVEKENDTHVSLPQKTCDMMLTASRTRDLAVSQNIRDFLMNIRLSVNGATSVPATVDVEINNETVCYLYSTAQYRTQAELDFDGQILQVSLVEGGKLSGRRIETSLVLHYEDDHDTVEADTKAFVKSAIKVIDSLDKMREKAALSQM